MASELDQTVDIHAGNIQIGGITLADICDAIPQHAVRAVVTELFSTDSREAQSIAREFVGEPELPDEIEEAIARLRRGEAGEALLLLERAFYPSVTAANEAAARRRVGEVRA